MARPAATELELTCCVLDPILRGSEARTESGRYVLDQAAHLCGRAAAGAQSQDGSDEVVREILETVDLVRLAAVADELGMKGWRR
jgi:hypothetical protein